MMSAEGAIEAEGVTHLSRLLLFNTVGMDAIAHFGDTHGNLAARRRGVDHFLDRARHVQRLRPRHGGDVSFLRSASRGQRSQSYSSIGVGPRLVAAPSDYSVRCTNL